jgi:uroporphyrinogen decarboxylase
MMSSLLIDACFGKPTPRPPVWMMRQAGRYLPEYRAVRSKVDFLTLCKTPELASQVTLQPVDILGVDGAVIFSDILVVLEAMGMPVEFGKDQGPRLAKPVSNEEDIKSLNLNNITPELKYVQEAIRLTSAALKSRNVPVIGFCGAPFTLACYAIEGKTSRDFHRTKKFMFENPKAFEKLLEKLADGVRIHLENQISAGARAVQIFDSWGGVLGSEIYAQWVLPALQRIIEPLKKLKVPIILYVNGSSHHLESMRKSGADVLSVDWRMSLSKVRQQVGPQLALQGNLDPTALYQSPEEIRKSTLKLIAEHPAPGWVANLGHGILPDVPVEHARIFVETIKAVQR